MATTTTRPLRILVVDDDPAMVGAITALVGTEGHQVITAYDGLTAVKRFREEHPDLVLLDLAMPGPDGFSVAGQMRAVGQAPILVVSGESGEAAKVRALGIGADDYLTKPFAMEELLARVEVLSRRTPVGDAPTRLVAGDVRMDVLKRKVTRNGDTVTLSPREFELLQILMQEPGRVFSRDEICERIWEREHEYDTRTVEIFVMRLRKKLDEGRDTALIETVRGVGYTLRLPT